jgi:hypothetical protein
MRTHALIAISLLIILVACAPAPPIQPPPTPTPPPAPSPVYISGEGTPFDRLEVTGLNLTQERLLVTPQEAANACGMTRSFGAVRIDSLFQTFQDTIAPFGRVIFEFTKFEDEDAARDSFIRRNRDLINKTIEGPNYVTGLAVDANGSILHRRYVFQEGTVSAKVTVIPRSACIPDKVKELIGIARGRIQERETPNW